MLKAEKMVRTIKEKYNLDSPRVFSAVLKVPREEFIRPSDKDIAHEDTALSIGWEQTISQPFTVVFMTNLLNLTGGEKVLEIGTGSGYQSAVLSLLCSHVYTIERIRELGESAAKRLDRLGFKNVDIKIGKGEDGWKKKAPFDRILITAGVKDVPKELFKQLKVGGILVAPIGEGEDKVMTKYTKLENLKKEEFGLFHFVPFVKSD